MADDRSEDHNLVTDGEHKARFVQMMHDFKTWANANHVLPGEQMKAYMRIHGYGSHRREQALLEASENASEDDVVQG
jgi:hypothetical protein